jgi:chromosome segregation ATPase
MLEQNDLQLIRGVIKEELAPVISIIVELKEDVAMLKEDVAMLKHEVGELRVDMDNVLLRLRRVEEELIAQRELIENHKNMFEGDINEEIKDVEKLKVRVTTLEQQVEQLKTQRA